MVMAYILINCLSFLETFSPLRATEACVCQLCFKSIFRGERHCLLDAGTHFKQALFMFDKVQSR